MFRKHLQISATYSREKRNADHQIRLLCVSNKIDSRLRYSYLEWIKYPYEMTYMHDCKNEFSWGWERKASSLMGPESSRSVSVHHLSTLVRTTGTRPHYNVMVDLDCSIFTWPSQGFCKAELVSKVFKIHFRALGTTFWAWSTEWANVGIIY